jgi:hypothetical protein
MRACACTYARARALIIYYCIKRVIIKRECTGTVIVHCTPSTRSSLRDDLLSGSAVDSRDATTRFIV